MLAARKSGWWGEPPPPPDALCLNVSVHKVIVYREAEMHYI